MGDEASAPAGEARMRIFGAIKADFLELTHCFNPWAQIRELRAEVNEHERRMEIIHEEHKVIYQLLTALDAKQIGIGAQLIEFGSDMEKLRLRLSKPEDVEAPNRPKTWTERRRELETEYATKSVTQENTDAGKGKPS